MAQAIHHHLSPLNSGHALKRSEAAEHEKLVKEAQKWVAQSFYGTLLKQSRQSPFHSDLMDGGRGGQAFGSLLDQHLAEHMAGSKAGYKLANAIVRKIEAKRVYAKASGKPTAANQKSHHLKPLRSIHATTALGA